MSIKTYSFRDWSGRTQTAGRYTKNIQRNGMELKDEADVIHRRQPYSVMVALFFLPIDACDDGDEGASRDRGVSSFASIVRRLRHRQGRAIDSNERLFDRYDLPRSCTSPCTNLRGGSRLAPVLRCREQPTANGRPSDQSLLTLSGLAAQIEELVGRRNTAGFDWEIAVAETEADEEEE